MDRDRDFAKSLEGFDAVWRRVRARRGVQAAAEARGIGLMPRRRKRENCCRRTKQA